MKKYSTKNRVFLASLLALFLSAGLFYLLWPGSNSGADKEIAPYLEASIVNCASQEKKKLCFRNLAIDLTGKYDSL